MAAAQLQFIPGDADIKGEIKGIPEVEVKDELRVIEGPSKKVRLGPVRSRLSNTGIDGATLVNFVQKRYLEWVSQDEYLVLGECDSLQGFQEFVAVKASKRGNDVYSKRIKDRMDPLMDLPDIRFFDWNDRSSRHRTRAMFVTLTYDPKGITIGRAWDQVGNDYNRWTSALRGRYGACSILRVWESQRNGYPHIHAIVLFQDTEFTAFHHGSDLGDGAWRIQGKRDMESLWPHGFTDIEALSSTRGGMHYIVKYLGKLHQISDPGLKDPGGDPGLSGLVSRASVLTLSLMWAFRKRAFSVSGDWIDLILDLHNSNRDPEYWDLLQVDLCGGAPAEGLKRWILLGFWSGRLYKGGNRPRWSVSLSRSEYRQLKQSDAWSDYRHFNGF